MCFVSRAGNAFAATGWDEQACMKNQKSEMETGWHVTWGLPMPENRALAGVIRRRRERREAGRIQK
jgi:hypothetical protein